MYPPTSYISREKTLLTSLDTESEGSLISGSTFTFEIGDIIFPVGDFVVDSSGVTEAFSLYSPKYSEIRFKVLRVGSVIPQQKSVKQTAALLTDLDEETRRRRQITKEEVYVICRSDNTASCDIADAYVTKRQLPAENKIEVDMTSLGFTWPTNQWECVSSEAIDVWKYIQEKLDQAEATAGREVRALVFAGNWPYYAGRPTTETWFPHSQRQYLGVYDKGYGMDFFNAFWDRDGFTKAKDFVETNTTISSYVSAMTEEQKDILAWFRLTGRRRRKPQNGQYIANPQEKKYEYEGVKHATRLLTPRPQVANYRVTAVSTLPAGRDDAYKDIAIQRVQDCIDTEQAKEEDFGIILNTPSSVHDTAGIDHVVGYRLLGLPEEKLFYDNMESHYNSYPEYKKYPDTGYTEQLSGQSIGILERVGHPDYVKVSGGDVGIRSLGKNNYYSKTFYIEEDGDVNWKKGAIVCTAQSYGARPPPQCGHDENWVMTGVIPTTITWNSPPNGVESIDVDEGGSGYNDASPPSVTISASASGTTAQASAVVSGGTVTSITVTDPGSIYSGTPTVTIDPPTSGTQATASANLQDNRIQINANSTDLVSSPSKRLLRLYASNNVTAPLTVQITDYASGGEVIITENGTETERFVWKDKTINDFYEDYNSHEYSSQWTWQDSPGEGHIPSKGYQSFRKGAAISLHGCTQEPNMNPSFWNLLPILYDGGSIADYLVAHEMVEHDLLYNSNHVVEYGDPLFSPFRYRTDIDNDGIPDWADPDDDNDGVADLLDAFPTDPTESSDSDKDGIGDNADLDDDNDGFPDSADQLPKNPDEQYDFDGDGVGDNVDADDDNDGVPDKIGRAHV